MEVGCGHNGGKMKSQIVIRSNEKDKATVEKLLELLKKAGYEVKKLENLPFVYECIKEKK